MVSIPVSVWSSHSLGGLVTAGFRCRLRARQCCKAKLRVRVIVVSFRGCVCAAHIRHRCKGLLSRRPLPPLNERVAGRHMLMPRWGHQSVRLSLTREPLMELIGAAHSRRAGHGSQPTWLLQHKLP